MLKREYEGIDPSVNIHEANRRVYEESVKKIRARLEAAKKKKLPKKKGK